MKFKIAHSFPATNEQDIQAFEKGYNLSLPLEYKTFILQHNGGEPKWNKIKMYDTKHDASLGTIVKSFLPLYKEAEDNLEAMYVKYAKEKVIPAKFLPVAFDPRKDLFCLSLRKRDYGAVYYFEIDDFDKENLKEEGRILAAASFPKFLDALAPEYDMVLNPTELVPPPPP
ncbi:SMI1/KNR4 family protein [Priestia filamentosa]|uniref:SMI1/KNR4 family protein n=1 Tax=Priestia filamentosa TaxID=1402861 RepID=UPI001C1E6925|nr:SMI1/KNR4 family protein [Priestia filamentosa]